MSKICCRYIHLINIGNKEKRKCQIEEKHFKVKRSHKMNFRKTGLRMERYTHILQIPDSADLCFSLNDRQLSQS